METNRNELALEQNNTIDIPLFNGNYKIDTNGNIYSFKRKKIKLLKTENLEWCTYSENNKHSYDTGLKKPSNLKISEFDKKSIIYLHKIGTPYKMLCQLYSVSHSTISEVINLKR